MRVLMILIAAPFVLAMVGAIALAGWITQD